MGLILRTIGYSRVEANPNNAEQIRASKSNTDLNIDGTRRGFSVNASRVDDDAVASYNEVIELINRTLKILLK